MKTGTICDIEYFMKNGCRGCKLSRLCEEKEIKDREKSEISLPQENELPNNKGNNKTKEIKVQ